MRKVERHLFVPDGLQREAYHDYPLPIGEGQTISQPYIVAKMTEVAGIKKGDKVLEIGTGSGYQAAVLAELGAEVYSIEIIEALSAKARRNLDAAGYNQVKLRVGDGYQGWKEAAPYDAIIVTAAPENVPQPLIDQLKINGRLVIPVGASSPFSHQQLKLVTKTEKGVEKVTLFHVAFVPMTGEAAKKERP
jgi:protein-L-isoaspartate(D-aspartate) O-methyltransferase